MCRLVTEKEEMYTGNLMFLLALFLYNVRVVVNSSCFFVKFVFKLLNLLLKEICVQFFFFYFNIGFCRFLHWCTKFLVVFEVIFAANFKIASSFAVSCLRFAIFKFKKFL